MADFLDLKSLTKFSLVCKSWYWIAGRQSVLDKFSYRKGKKFDQYEEAEDQLIYLNQANIDQCLAKYRDGDRAS